MTLELPHMDNSHIAAGFIGMSAAIGVMWKWIIGELKALKKKVPELEEKLNQEIRERHKSDLKALRNEIEAKMPCHHPECPKKATYSIGTDQCPLGGV